MNAAWVPYSYIYPEHTVSGDLRILPGLYSPELGLERDILAWLPPSYQVSSKRYPVIYMHDGQNLFDENTSYVGEWRVDETLTELAGEDPRLDCIIVGIPNHPTERFLEYNPYSIDIPPESRSKGEAYITFLVETVKPLVDRAFRTQTGRTSTGVAGSSAGGLISLYAHLTRPAVFGLCGAFSPAFWYGAKGLLHTLQAFSGPRGRVYLDVGTAEGETFANLPPERRFFINNPDQVYVDGVRMVHDRLAAKGYTDGADLLYIEDEGAQHNEEAWARRFPAAVRFLIG